MFGLSKYDVLKRGVMDNINLSFSIKEVVFLVSPFLNRSLSNFLLNLHNNKKYNFYFCMREGASEEILQQGLAEGNVKIFDYLFHYYYSGLVVFAMKLVVEKEIAEDIVQDFFYKLWSEREKHSINSSLKSYFFSSVRNRCLDHLRHNKVSEKAGVFLAQQMEQDAYDESNYLVEEELRERIHDAIGKLPEKCRKIFVMNRLEGLKPTEIAEKENISVRTVEGHIGKASKLLRKELQSYLPAYIITLLIS